MAAFGISFSATVFTFNIQASAGIVSGSDGSIGLFASGTGGGGANLPQSNVLKATSASLSYTGSFDGAHSSIDSFGGKSTAGGASTTLPVRGPLGTNLAVGADHTDGGGNSVSVGLGVGKPRGEAHYGGSQTHMIKTSLSEVAHFWVGVAKSAANATMKSFDQMSQVPVF